VQYALLVILIGALCGGVFALVWMAWNQRRRRKQMARLAHEMGMKFSSQDPFELSRRYSSFALFSAGHSRRAENVMYGRHGSWYFRAFDYSFELGHGTRRLVRRCSVIVADTDLAPPAGLLWHVDDTDHLPLPVAGTVARAGPWLLLRGGEHAVELSELFGTFGEQPVNVETAGRSVMLWLNGIWQVPEFAARIRQAAAALDALRARRRQGAGQA